jgi:DNA-binding MarR family transcriptional regulator
MSAQSVRGTSENELAPWSAYMETAELLRATLAAGLHADAHLSSADYTVMLALTQAEGGRLRHSRLADTIGWQHSRLSHHLGRMERRGLVTREDCAEDGRGAWLELTSLGSSMFLTASAPYQRLIRELFLDVLSTEQLEAVEDIARALRAGPAGRPGSGHRFP